MCAAALLAAAAARQGAAQTSARASGIIARGDSAALVRAISAYVEAQRSIEHVPGIAVAVVAGERVLFAGGFGLENVESQAPASDRTAFSTLSVGKQITATIVMRLVERGRIALSDSAARYVPSLALNYGGVTVQQLLSHTSGIPDYTNVRDWRAQLREDRSPDVLIAPALASAPRFAPGARWEYSNTNYYVLGLIIAAATGAPYERAVDDLAGDAGMSSTRLDDLSRIVPHRAGGYVWNAGSLFNDERPSPTQVWAAGGFVTTVRDLARWEIARFTHALLRPETLRLMEEPARLAGGDSAPYGIANELSRDHDHRVAGHQGGGLGFNTAIRRYVDDSVSVIVLTNLRTGPSERIAAHIAGFLIPGLNDEANAGIADSKPSLTQRLRRVLQDASHGVVDSSLIAPASRQELVPFIRTTGPRFLGTLGELTQFTLLEEKPLANRGTERRYRAVFGTRTLIWTFVLDDEGRIRSLEPS